MKTIIQKVKFKAGPEKLFEMYMDSKKHSLATGGKAVLSRKVGGSFTAWEGYIRGKNLALLPGKMIVQTWRTTTFKRVDQDSILVLTFEKTPGGALMIMIHTAVPDSIASKFKTGWQKHYWEPWKKYLAGL